MSRMMGGGLSPSRPSGVKEEGAEHPGADAAQAGAAVQGGEEAAGARKRTQQERSPARAGMASSKLRKADDVVDTIPFELRGKVCRLYARCIGDLQAAGEELRR